jgi:hypothetical protein
LENLKLSPVIHTEGCNNLAYDFRSYLQVPLSLSLIL